MVVIVDKEAKEIITKLGDIALRAGGLQNMQPVTNLLNAMKMYKEPPPEKPDKGDQNGNEILA